jgi:hypothetical protein
LVADYAFGFNTPYELIETSKKGVEHRDVVREADINARIPRLLKTIVGFSE